MLSLATILSATPAFADFQKFKSKVIEALNKVDGIAEVRPGQDDQTLIIKLKKPEKDDDHIKFYLGNAYREYSENPADLNEILEQYIGVVRQAAVPTQFSTSKLFVLLRPTDYIVDDDRKYVRSRLRSNKLLDWKSQALAFGLFGADMMSSLVLDEGDRFSYVRSEVLVEQKLSFSSAVKTGLENLKALISERDFSEIDGVWHLSTDQSSLTSSLLFDKNFWIEKAKQFPNGMIAAIPAREVVLVVEAGSIDNAQKLTAKARIYYDDTSHPQSTFLFYWKNGAWQPGEEFR